MTNKPSVTISLVEAYSELEPEYLLICTFTLGLGYIEQKFLNSFKEKHNTKTLIVSSATGVTQSFDEFYAVRGVGTQYILAKVDDAPYAFHPKVLLAIDRNLGPILYVTGCNFTYPGMAQNLDAVEFIELHGADRQTIANVNSFLDGLSDLVLLPEQEKILTEIKRRLPDGLEAQSSFTFFHNMQVPIFDQITEATEGEVEEIKIISPYYDHGMRALTRFAELPGNPRCSILCNPGDEHVNLAALPAEVSVFTTSEEASGRLLHAKVYLIKTATKTYSCVGSANCTEPGMLKIPNDDGNWEAVVLREILPDYAEEFFQSFSPSELMTEAHWEYKAPEKIEIDHKRISFEVVTHPGMLELQFSKGHTLGALEGVIFLKFVTGEQESFPLDIEFPNPQGSYFILIDSSSGNAGDRPFLVELELTAPFQAFGSAWAIQKTILSRSKATQSLLKKLDELQSDTAEGWSQFDTLMSFITGNLGYLSARRRKPSKKTQSSTQTNTVYTIEGVVELDEKVSVVGHNEMTMADMLHSGSRLDSFFESGFLVTEGEDDESDDQELEDKPPRQRKPHRDDEQDRTNTQPIPEFELPDLRMIYQDQIIKKYNQRIKSMGKEGSEEDLGSILSSLVFSLKLARFIHVELTHKFPMKNRDPQQLFSVIAPILTELPVWVEKSKELLNLSDEQIVDHFESSEFLQEFVLNVCEMWAEDRQDVIRFTKKVELVQLLKQFWSEEQITASMNSILHGSNRFAPGRRNLIMDPDSAEEIVSSMWSLESNGNKYASMYRMAMRIRYFVEAVEHHQRAYDKMIHDPDFDKKIESNERYRGLVEVHRTRPESAKKYIEHALGIIKSIISSQIVEENLGQGSGYTLAPIHKDGSTLCPKCSKEITPSEWLRFRSGLHLLCRDCNALMIPAEQQRKYDYHTATDPVWKEMLD